MEDWHLDRLERLEPREIIDPSDSEPYLWILGADLEQSQLVGWQWHGSGGGRQFTAPWLWIVDSTGLLTEGRAGMEKIVGFPTPKNAPSSASPWKR